jgi:hypothetical protein
LANQHFAFLNINLLEAHGLLFHIRWVIKHGYHDTRIVVIVDSGFLKGAVRKFRSSSKALNFILRQMGGLCLGFGIYLEVLWAPTWANPGDAPSRMAGLETWRPKAEGILKRTRSEILQDELLRPQLEQVDIYLSEDVAFMSPPVSSPTQPKPKPQPKGTSEAKGRNQCLDLFCGSCGLGLALHRQQFEVECVDCVPFTGTLPAQNFRLLVTDLASSEFVDGICDRIHSGRICFVGLAIPCSSFSILRIRSRTTSRTRSRPWGSNRFPGERLGNRLIRNCLRIIRACLQAGVFWILENPQSSRVFDLPPVARLLRQNCVESAIIDQCMYGQADPAPGVLFRKRTRFIGNLPGLAQLSCKCSGDHPHQHIEDSTIVDGKSVKRSIVAGHNPSALCDAIAHCLSNARSSHRQLRRERLSPLPRRA